MADDDRALERRELAEFANAGAQRNQPVGAPHGHALVRPTTGISERVIGAQPVAVRRDEQQIMQKLAQIGAMAGRDWFYRFPVRGKEGGQDWIEGPSIKLANDVARIFGNNINEVREIDVGDAWVFYARFTDVETGFSMERAYRQRKSQKTMGKDNDRQLDIAYQIGQSKAIRNAIVNSLQLYADFAFEEARNSLVDKIGKDLDGWRTRTIESLKRHRIDLHRAERAIGRPAKDWLAPDIARLVAMGQAVADGMATIDETFPAEKTEEKPAEASTEPQSTEPELQQGAAESETESEQPANEPAPEQPKAAPTTPKNFAEYLELVTVTAANAVDAERLRAWFVSDQQRRIRNGAGLVADETAQARKIVENRCKQLSKA